MRLPALRLIAVIGIVLAGAASAAGTAREAPDDAEAISQWAAPPYWTPQSDPEARAHGRQALAAGPTALPFISLFPCRLVDTRAPAFPAPLSGGFLPPATVRSYTLTGVCNVPANAQAISLNVTVVKPTGPGFITLWPQGGAFPPVSTLNYLGNDVIVNAAVVPLSATGGISMALGVSGGDVILDTNGYYASVASVTSLNALAGDLTLAAGSNVTLTPSGQTLTIASTGGPPTGPAGGALSGTYPSPGIAANAVGATQIGAGAVGSTQLAPNAVGTAQLAAGAVTDAKVASGISYSKLAGAATMSNLHVNAPASATPISAVSIDVQSFGTSGNAVASHYFRVRDIGSGSPSAFFIRGDGKIGVGTEAPEQNLHVHGDEVLSTGASSGFKFRERGSISSNDDWVWYSEGNVARLWRAGSGTMFAVDSLGITSTQLLSIGALSLAGSTHLCINNLTQVATCSSSLRYKTNIAPLHFGLNVVRQLHPILFDWKTDGSHDVGFGAEDVAAINPLFVTYNAEGDIEGVKYDRLSTVFVNAFKEQQAAIEKQEREIKRQQMQIDTLKKLVCADHPVAEVCVP